MYSTYKPVVGNRVEHKHTETYCPNRTLPVLPDPSCEALGELLVSSEWQFPIHKNGGNSNARRLVIIREYMESTS